MLHSFRKNTLTWKGTSPDVTVIIPIYNKSKYVEACLKSVLRQTGISLELICVDDCSTDGSWEIASELARSEPGMRLARNSVNSGAARSRNLGISLARGRYIQFTDADDLLPPGALAALFHAAKRAGAEVARGTVEILAAETAKPWAKETIKTEKLGLFLDLPELWIPWFHTCFLISRHLIVRENIKYPNLVTGEDPVFIAKVLTKAKRIFVTPRPTYRYREPKHRPKPIFKTIDDYLSHAQLVKSEYSRAHYQCWEVYRNFIKRDVGLLISQANLTEAEHAIATEKFEKI